MKLNCLYCKNKLKKMISAILCMVIIVSSCCGIVFAVNTYPSDKEITIQLSNATEPSYIVTDSGAGVWKSHVNINGALAVFSIPIPEMNESQTIKNFKFKFTTTHQQGYASAFTVYNLPGNQNPASMKLSDVRDIMADRVNTVTDIESTDNNGGFSWPSLDNVADITAFVKKAKQNNMSYVYVGVMASNSTEIFGTDLYSSEYGMGLFPCEIFTLTGSDVSEDEEYVFQTPSSEKIESDIREKLSGKAHPFLHADSAKLESIKSAVKSGADEFVIKEYEQTLAEANALISQPVLNHGKKVTQDAVYVRGRILSLMTVYYVQGGEAYLTRAMAEFENLQTIETWTAGSQLDNTMTMEAIGVCYDWLYNYLSDEQKAWAETVIKEKGLSIAYEYFQDPSCLSALRAKYNNMNIVLSRGKFNHTVYNNSNLITAALAIAPKDPAYSAYIIANCLYNIEPYWELVRDGGFEEPVTYYNYCSGKTVFAMSALYSALGTMYDYEKSPGFKNTAWYPIYMYGPFTFGDGGATMQRYATDILYFYAKHSKDNKMLKRITDLDSGSPVDTLLWYDSGDLINIDFAGELPLDKFFPTPRQSTAVFRNHLDDSSNIFAGLYAGCGTATGHSDAVSGLFCLDAFGERFITALGFGDYNLPGYFDNAQNGQRWDYYERRTEGGNCLVINPDEGVGQDVSQSAVISDFKSGSGSAFAIADLTNVYPDAESYKRGLKLHKNRSSVLVRDELVLKQPSDIFWSFNTPADIRILDDSTALLSVGAKKVLIKISSNVPYELFEMKAESLPSSPRTEYQKEFHGYRKLAIRADDISELKLSVEFTPVACEDDITGDAPDQTDCEFWSVDERSFENPVLNGILIDGNALADFEAQNRFYEIKSDNITGIPAITPVADEGISCEVTYPDYVPGTAYIKLEDKSGKSVYAITFTKSTSKEAVTELSHERYPSYYVTDSSSVKWQSRGALINRGTAVYTLPLPSYTKDRTIKNFKFKFSTAGDAGYSFRLINLPGSLTPSELTSESICDMLSDTSNLVDGAYITSELNAEYTGNIGTSAYTNIADITELAKKAYENKEKNLYMAVVSDWTVSAFSTQPYYSNGEAAWGILPGCSYTLGSDDELYLVTSSPKDGAKGAKFSSEINYCFSKPVKKAYAYVNGEEAQVKTDGAYISVHNPELKQFTDYEVKLGVIDYDNQYTMVVLNFSTETAINVTDQRDGEAWHITSDSNPEYFAISTKSVKYSSNSFAMFILPVPKLEEGYELTSYTLETYVGKNDSVYALKFPGENWRMKTEGNSKAIRFSDPEVSTVTSDWYTKKDKSAYIAFDSVSYSNNRATFELASYVNECMQLGQSHIYVALISEWSAGAWGFSVTSTGSARYAYTADINDDSFMIKEPKLVNASQIITDYSQIDTGLTADSGSSYRILSEYTNLSGEDKCIGIFAAVYDSSGRICEAVHSEDTVLYDDSVLSLINSESFTLTKGDTLKIFIWYAGKTVPVCSAVSYSIR